MSERSISHRLTSLVLPIRASRSVAQVPPSAAAVHAIPEPISRMYAELYFGVSEDNETGGVSETHLLPGRPIIQTTTTDATLTKTAGIQATATQMLRADVTAGTGLTKSIETIPRHAQRLFLLNHQPAQYPQPPAPIPTTQAAARWSKRTAGTAQSRPMLRSSRTVRCYQANGYPIATNAFLSSARNLPEQH